MSIGEICTRDVIVANRKDSVLDVAKLMRKYHVGDVVIVDQSMDQNFPVGIITDRDIVLELVAKEIGVGSVMAEDVMSTDLLIAEENEQLTGLVQQMQSKGVRRVPVINAKGGLIGIISEDDIVEIIGEQLSNLASLVNRGGHREYATRA
jgi:CBS domain-containing protein